MNDLPQETWKRLGFPHPPDSDASGRGVGVVVLDRLKPHPTLRHLGSRLQYVTVGDDFRIVSREIAFDPPDPVQRTYGEHGLMVLNAMAHAPFIMDGREYTGLAPATHYIVFDYGQFKPGEIERLLKGMEWILDWRKRSIRSLHMRGLPL